MSTVKNPAYGFFSTGDNSFVNFFYYDKESNYLDSSNPDSQVLQELEGLIRSGQNYKMEVPMELL